MGMALGLGRPFGVGEEVKRETQGGPLGGGKFPVGYLKKGLVFLKHFTKVSTLLFGLKQNEMALF